LKISDLIYKLINNVKGLKTLQFIRVIEENKDKTGWTRLTYEEFKHHGFYPDSLNRVIKECIGLGILEIVHDEHAKGIKKGAIPKKYRIKATVNQLK